MKPVLILAIMLVDVIAAADPLTISEHKDRYEANGATPYVGQPFDMVGQVMLVCDEHPRRITLIDRDRPGTICIFDSSPEMRYRIGDILRAQGVRVKNITGYERQVPNDSIDSLTNLQVVGHEKLPPTRPATAEDVNFFKTGRSFIHVDGVLASAMRDASNAEWNWILLRTANGFVRAAATDRGVPALFAPSAPGRRCTSARHRQRTRCEPKITRPSHHPLRLRGSFRHPSCTRSLRNASPLQFKYRSSATNLRASGRHKQKQTLHPERQ